jgi:hypothetical protein
VRFCCFACPFFWPSRVALPPTYPPPPTNDIRYRARRIHTLELLGKMTDVGLFTERKEITVTHQNAAELREKLREKLEVLKKNADGVYEVVDEGGSDAEP